MDRMETIHLTTAMNDMVNLYNSMKGCEGACRTAFGTIIVQMAKDFKVCTGCLSNAPDIHYKGLHCDSCVNQSAYYINTIKQ